MALSFMRGYWLCAKFLTLRLGFFMAGTKLFPAKPFGICSPANSVSVGNTSTNSEIPFTCWPPLKPGAEKIKGALVACSKLLCFAHIVWSPKCQPWSPQSTIMVFLSRPCSFSAAKSKPTWASV